MSNSEPPRVVTLLPSATEIVAALGVDPVASSHVCDHPPRMTETPTVVESRIDADGSSGEIDEQVQHATAENGVFRIDREALAAADPDIVVTQGTCEVCAVETVVVESAIEDLGLDCEVVTIDPHSVDDILTDIETIGEALGRTDRAGELVDELQARIDSIATAAADSPIRPDVAVLDWLDPPMVAGHWVPELVEMAGGKYEITDPTDASTPREWSEIRDYDPDILVAAPCGFDLAQTFENRRDLTDREGWSSLRAVRMNRVYAMDGHHLVNRGGLRVVETLETLASLIQPETFDAPDPSMARSFSDHPK